jgi:hypothetical protein
MDEFSHHTQDAKEAVLRIRSLNDRTVLEGMDHGSRAFTMLLVLMGPDTNHFWITSECAEEAYRRGLIDEAEFDRRTR